MLNEEIKQTAIAELEQVLANVSAEQIDALVSEVLTARRIYLFALGRTLLMGRALIMRLMHLGLDAFVVGDTNTPGLNKTDLLILCSASGQTDISLLIVEKAEKRRINLQGFLELYGEGAEIIAFCENQRDELQVVRPQ